MDKQEAIKILKNLSMELVSNSEESLQLDKKIKAINMAINYLRGTIRL